MIAENKFYVLLPQNSEEFIRPGLELTQDAGFVSACASSSLQMLDRRPMTITTGEDGGVEFPDFLTAGPLGAVPLVSERLKEAIDDFRKNGEDNPFTIFYKPIKIVDDLMGEQRQYYLALPTRIDCLDRARSQLTSCDEDGDAIAQKIVVNPRKAGHYQIFRIAGIENTDIIVGSRFKSYMDNHSEIKVAFKRIEV